MNPFVILIKYNESQTYHCDAVSMFKRASSAVTNVGHLVCVFACRSHHHLQGEGGGGGAPRGKGGHHHLRVDGLLPLLRVHAEHCDLRQG